MASGETIATEAFRQLEKQIGVSQRQAFSNTSLADVLQTVHGIEDEQGKRHHLLFMKRIESFIYAVNSYREIFGILCQGRLPMGFIWGLIKWTLHMIKDDFDIIDPVLQAYKEIADNLPRLDLIRSAFPESKTFDLMVGWIYSDLLEFHGHIYKIFRRRAWHFFFKFDWRLNRKRFNSLLQRLRRYCDMLDMVPANTHFPEVRDFRDQRKEEDDEMEKRKHFEMFQDVLTWLSESQGDQEEFLCQLSEERQVETCNWVLKEPEVVCWLGDGSSGRTLWMTGIPGSGKSFLSSMIIQHLQTRRSGSCAFFFCSYSASADVNCIKVLSNFTTQILRKNLDIAPLIHEAFVQKGFCRTTTVLKRLLAQVLPELQPTTFVLDGLDELELCNQKEILKSLKEILNSPQVSSRLLVSSRAEPEIRKFPFHSQLTLEGKTEKALGLYIRNTVKELKSHHNYIDDRLSNQIDAHLREKADGMFLWVRLVFAMLDEKGSYSDMKNAISDLPNGLNEAYGRIVARIQKNPSRLRVFKILSWLCVGRRPVSIDEVVDGIALDFEQRDLNKETRISDPGRAILDLCAPLLEMSRSKTVGLVHFSAKEYLVSDQSGMNGPFLERAWANFTIARSCIINIVSALDFIRSDPNLSKSELETRTVKGTYGLMAYSAEFWADHLLSYLSESQKVDACEKQKILSLSKSLHSLSKRRTEQNTQSRPPGITDKLFKGSKELEHEPELLEIVIGCLELPLKLNEIKANFNDPRQQELQLSLSDNTFMTLITTRIRDTTDRILTFITSTLPSHIEAEDHKAFVNRFGWRCIYAGCHREFNSQIERSTHEETHVISFPCSYCDFFIKGFRSPKELERHIRNYHLDLNDFEVPTSLHPDDSIIGTTVTIALRKNQLSPWNKRGLKAAQDGLHQILRSIKTHGSQSLDSRPRLLETDVLRLKIDQHQYQSLEGFKQDLRQTMGGTEGQDDHFVNRAIEEACQNGLKYATASYPDFAGVEGNLSIDDSINFRTPPNSNGSIAWIESVQDEKANHLSLSEDLISNRDVYWSEKEKNEFPNLLEKFGRDFSKIAEDLGSKSREDIDEFYMHLIKERPDMEHFVLKSESTPDDLPQTDHGPSPAVETVEDSHLASNLMAGTPPVITTAAEPMTLHYLSNPIADQQHQQLPRSNAPIPAAEQVEGTHAQLPLRKKRVRRRAHCDECTLYPNGLHDDGALQKHKERYHKRYRKVWICSDISDDKSFLNGCNACKVGKRYKRKLEACKHLKVTHFTPDSKLHELGKWLREEEEPNPSFGLKPGEKPPRSMPNSKRQKTDETTFQIAPLRFASQGNALLPSIRMSPELNEASDGIRLKSDQDQIAGHKHSSPLASDSDVPDPMLGIENSEIILLGPDQPEVSENAGSGLLSPLLGSNRSDASNNDIEARSKVNDQSSPELVLPDVSFDNMMGNSGVISGFYDSNGKPHRSRQALIKPDEVLRLPHLDKYRKEVFYHQVMAMHFRLDTFKVDTKEYKEQLEKLEESSRTLLRNLQNWKREQSRAPELPFSLN